MAGAHRPQIRMLVLLACWAAGSLALGARLVDLQVLEHATLERRAEINTRSRIEVPGPRGRILDRNGRILAISVPSGTLVAQPSGISREVLAEIGRIAGRRRWLLNRAGSENWLEVTRACDEACRAAIAELEASGRVPGHLVEVVDSYRRVYPHGQLAAHVLGFVNRNGVAEGAEREYDPIIRGSTRELIVLRDGRLKVFGAHALPSAAPEPDSVVLSIDVRVQALLEQELTAALSRHEARGARGVVLDPRTGEVLAMAAVPAFDPNDFGARPQYHGNPVIRSTFEPGSVIKPLAAAAVVEWGRYTAGERVDCEQGSWKVSGRPIRDHDSFGLLTLGEVLEVSSNIGIAKFSGKLRPQELFTTLDRFGLGKPTGIDLPVEASGKVPPADKWRGRDRLVIPFGYGLSTTTLQLATAYAIIANGGWLVQPRVGILRTRPDGRSVPLAADEARGERVLSGETARVLRAWLHQVVSGEKGTGRAARLASYETAGKTGTAERAGADGYSHDDHVTSFAGFAPADDPALVAVITIDGPRRNGRMASSTAAPVFRSVMEETLRLLRVEPRLPVQRAAADNAAVREAEARR